MVLLLVLDIHFYLRDEAIAHVDFVLLVAVNLFARFSEFISSTLR